MTQPLDFSNQMLIGRSFKGQNLAGANFRNADIRGCDFSNANLEGADFSGVTAGQSSNQILISFSFASAFPFVLVTASASAFTSASGEALWVAGVIFISSSLRSGEYAVANGAVAGAVAGAVPSVVAVAVAEFTKGNIFGGIGYSLLALFFLFLSYIFLITAIKGIRKEIRNRNTMGTSFKLTELTNTKFTGAILNNCDFTDAKLHQTDWTDAHFMRCKFSGYLDNQPIRELCVSRIGANENFSSMDLSGLNLIGVNICGGNLADANLSQTNLSQADLTNANLCNVQAIKTDFTGANLYGANLFDANLSQTNLNQANLTNANLCNVQAIKTDFSNANLSGACIENWAITPETNFTNVICSHIFLDSARTERQPASGFLEQGDFAKLVIQSTKSLNFFFHNGIDPQAFDFAFKKLRDEYPEMELSIKAIEDLGDGAKQIRLNTVSNAPKAEMHAQFTQNYEAMHQQLEASRNKVWELELKLDRIDSENKLGRIEIEKELAELKGQYKGLLQHSDYLENLIYHQNTQLGNQRFLYASNSTINMTDKSIQSGGGDISYVGRDNKGVSGKDQQGVAGRDISGTVTNTIQQLRETNQPEAPQLSDLLEQLQKVVESSDELDKPEKEKALDYLNKIVEMSVKEPAQKKGMLPILLDAFTGVISKAANLIDPVKKIAAAILSIWQA